MSVEWSDTWGELVHRQHFFICLFFVLPAKSHLSDIVEIHNVACAQQAHDLLSEKG